ncbi:hypothetical protein J2X97_002128 [Epilithonimonas hungarica]|uniref:hypothetical protein n=1 Tax=Epilithonimonas hungarica TaxID=454006 RepID=UPI00277E566D|nr:hypothetical protein [Epilithonimonas hungarica]MDP9956469.1 hypothetical protein [Epilithonimonas hungarica]
MKKITVFFLVFSCILTFAQNKKILFTKELKYGVVDSKNKNRTIDIDVFGNTSNELLVNAKVDQFPLNVFVDNLGVSPVSFGMNSQLENSFYSPFFSQIAYEASPDGKGKDIEVKKIDGTETILGLPCQYYLLNFKEANKDESLKVCVNENYPINTFSALNGIIKVFTRSNYSNELKGLVLKAGVNDNQFDTEHFVLKSIKDSEAFVYFDHKQSMMKHQRRMDSLMLEQKRWEEDYADSTTVYSDSAYAYDKYIPEYVSTYKQENKEMATLSIDNPDSKDLLKGAPKYCTNIQNGLPTFENKNLSKHLYNYVGQVCDMYLTQSYSETVDEKGTMDEIRREVLYLLNIRDELSKSDKKKLDKYLDQLD